MKIKNKKNNYVYKLLFSFVFIFTFLGFQPVQASDISIRSFSPTSGNSGDLVTILGFNFYQINKVLVGTIEATVTNRTLSTTVGGFDQLEIKIPSGAVTGKITIQTVANGTAVSTENFTVNTTPVPSDLKWWFIDNAHSHRGPFETPEQCRAELAAEKIATGNNTLGDCFQRTAAQVAAEASSTDIVQIPAMQVDGGSGVYKLLAPIGSLTEIDTTGKTCPGNPDIGNGIGCYLNIIFKIGIGLCAALAVIMLVINGIKYMTSESFTEKSELKKEMGGPILGLFIALGAFAILNTINPALTGSNGIQVDQVTADIVRDRADDPDFINNIDSFDISNITINPSDYNDPAFLGYLGHQQGVAGASAILWAAKKGYPNVPNNNPFTKSDINKNMKNNFNAHSAQITIGTSNLTPANFLKYWAIKMAAAKKKTVPQIPASIDTALTQVANETGVGIAELRAVCRIESAKGCTNDPTSIITVNSIGYAGLFQLSNKEHQSRPGVWEKYKKSNGILLKAYDNAFAAAQYFKTNLSGINTNWTKINS